MTREEAIKTLRELWRETNDTWYEEVYNMAIEALTDRPTGSWISEIDTGTWMLKCSVCGCRVQEEKYRTAVGQSATKCPYCGAELGLGGYSYDDSCDDWEDRDADI